MDRDVVGEVKRNGVVVVYVGDLMGEGFCVEGKGIDWDSV